MLCRISVQKKDGQGNSFKWANINKLVSKTFWEAFLKVLEHCVQKFYRSCYVSAFLIPLHGSDPVGSLIRCTARDRVMNDQQRVEEGCELGSLCGIRMVKGAEGALKSCCIGAGLTTLRAAVGFRPVYTPFARKPVTVLDPGSTFWCDYSGKTV